MGNQLCVAVRFVTLLYAGRVAAFCPDARGGRDETEISSDVNCGVRTECDDGSRMGTRPEEADRDQTGG